MKKQILDFTVISNDSLTTQYYLLKIHSPLLLPPILPGQFVEIRVDHAPDVFLRRPISIHFIDYVKNVMWLLIQRIGKGTEKLHELKPGDTLNLIVPLGNSFTLTPTLTHGKAVLIGGGVGIAPLLFLGSELSSKGIQCDFLLGAKSKENLLQLDEFARYGNVFTTTEDGTHGEKGYVTTHSMLTNNAFDIIYSCGPTPMMKAVAKFASKSDIMCEVSLENTMACGFGACLCCVTDSIDGHVCVCTDGPVFNINKLKW